MLKVNGLSALRLRISLYLEVMSSRKTANDDFEGRNAPLSGDMRSIKDRSNLGAKRTSKRRFPKTERSEKGEPSRRLGGSE